MSAEVGTHLLNPNDPNNPNESHQDFGSLHQFKCKVWWRLLKLMNCGYIVGFKIYNMQNKYLRYWKGSIGKIKTMQTFQEVLMSCAWYGFPNSDADRFHILLYVPEIKILFNKTIFKRKIFLVGKPVTVI